MRPGVIIGAEGRRKLVAGAAGMARILAPTLGPMPRTVLVGAVVSVREPEVLDHGATIARRVYELGDRTENLGAMLIRHVAWRMFERVGDGTATAAVLAAHLLAEADRLLAAGLPAREIGDGFRLAGERAAATIAGAGWRMGTRAGLAAFVAGILPEPGPAAIVTEVVDSLPEDGAILVEDSAAAETSHEYVDGMRWEGGWLPPFASSTEATLRLERPRILVTDIPVETREQATRLIEVAQETTPRDLLVIAPSVGDVASAFLKVNRNGRHLGAVAAAALPAAGPLRDAVAGDLAAGAGARYLSAAAGDRLEAMRPADLGEARLAWVRRRTAAILGGRGDRPALRMRLAEARAALQGAAGDAWLAGKLRERIGRLSGATAVVLVGARDVRRRDMLKTRVEAAVAATRAARRDGVVAGGGLALVRAARMVAEGLPPGRRPVAAAFARALEAPLRTIHANAGRDPARALEEVARHQGETFDVVAGTWGPEREGVADPLPVVLAALDIATSAVLSVVATGAIVHARHPEALGEA